MIIFGRAVARSLAQSLARSLARSLGRSLGRSPGRSLARPLRQSYALRPVQVLVKWEPHRWLGIHRKQVSAMVKGIRGYFACSALYTAGEIRSGS